METMYDRIKRMSLEEMKAFIYWVYLMGREDEKTQITYFDGYMLTLDKEEVMPTDSISDLWDKLDALRESRKTDNK